MGKAAVIMVSMVGGMTNGSGGCVALLHVVLYQVACFVELCNAGLRLPLSLRGGLLG